MDIMHVMFDLAGQLAHLSDTLGQADPFHLFIGCLGGLASLATLYDVATRATERHRHARRERDGEQDE